MRPPADLARPAVAPHGLTSLATGSSVRCNGSNILGARLVRAEVGQLLRLRGARLGHRGRARPVQVAALVLLALLAHRRAPRLRRRPPILIRVHGTRFERSAGT